MTLPGETAAAAPPGRRLVQVDALRGLAAVAVVLFHYTSRYFELFAPGQSASLAFPGGHYGVNLFFIISGFVIFMTLEKTARPMDFVVSRFSRLYPAFWVAVATTFVVTHLLGLPGKLASVGDAVVNLLMFHGFFNVPHVDSVYWTLEVELLFYCGMLLLFQLRRLDRIHLVLRALLALHVVYLGCARFWQIDLPWTISRLLILDYIGWFSLGISIYLLSVRRDAAERNPALLTAACAIVTLTFAHGAGIGALAAILALTAYAAATGRLRLLERPLFVWLGAISYPLYLLHENIGWSIQLQLSRNGLSHDTAILAAIATSLILATALSRTVEQPVMRWIRDRYRRRAGPPR